MATSIKIITLIKKRDSNNYQSEFRKIVLNDLTIRRQLSIGKLTYSTIDRLGRDKSFCIVDNGGAIDCRLSFTRLKQFPRYFWAEIHLETGRKHQIRLQFSQRGFPLLGDYKYGSRQKFPDGIALHCRSITFEHPTRKEVMTFTAPVPNCWKKFGVE